jgi:hypothetical protein
MGRAKKDKTNKKPTVPEYCGDPLCLCSGGEHIMCLRGKDRDQHAREMLESLGWPAPEKRK